MLRVAAVLAMLAAVAAPTASGAAAPRLPDDATIAGIAVGGLGPVGVDERVTTTESIRFSLPKEVRH